MSLFLWSMQICPLTIEYLVCHNLQKKSLSNQKTSKRQWCMSCSQYLVLFRFCYLYVCNWNVFLCTYIYMKLGTRNNSEQFHYLNNICMVFGLFDGWERMNTNIICDVRYCQDEIYINFSATSFQNWTIPEYKFQLKKQN